MPQTTIDHLIINSPYEEMRYHRRYNREMRLFDLRLATGVVAVDGKARLRGLSEVACGDFAQHRCGFNRQPDHLPRVKAWWEAGYPGTTSITKRLLERWSTPWNFAPRGFFFCQLEAVKKLI